MPRSSSGEGGFGGGGRGDLGLGSWAQVELTDASRQHSTYRLVQSVQSVLLQPVHSVQ